MAETEIKKVIRIDADDANRTLDELNNKIDKVQKSVDNINNANDDSKKTVKDLRNEIKSLRDELVNLDKGSDEYNSVVKQLIENESKLTDVMRAGKNEVSAATGSYNALQNEMTALRKVWKETTDEAQRNEIGARIREINDQLKELDASIGNNQRKVGAYEEALRAVNGQYSNQRQELSALKKALDNLDPSSEEYIKAFNRAAEITHNLAERQEMLKYSSTDLGDQLSNLNGIASNLAAGFSAANAAIGLFGGETKEVQEAMLKVQRAMALVQGLQGLDGFIKRTKGLSEAMKVWIANAKAAKTATEAQTVAQRGLNAAMKANPIGILVTAIVLLIANWKKLTEWVGKLVGGFDNLNKAMNKVKQVASGVANALIKAFLVPFKEIINYAKTLGKVMVDIFTFKWDKIGEDIKNGLNGAIDIVKDGYNVVGNYTSAKEKEITKQTEREIKKRATARKAELDDIIADNEAKSGSDWKYTEEGKQYYQEYFENLLLMYKKDTKEFKEAQREKWEYDREVAEKEKEAKEKAAKEEEERRKKSLAAAKDAKTKLEKIESDYQSKVGNVVGSDLSGIYKEYDEKYKAFTDYYKNIATELEKSAKQTDKKLAAWLNHYTEQVKSYNELFKRDNKRIIEETKAFLKGLSVEEFGDFFKQSAGEEYWEAQFGSLTDEGKLEKWKDWVERMGEETAISFSLGLKMRFINERNRIEKLYESIVTDSIENSSREANTKINDEIIKLFQKTIVPKVDDELVKLQNEIDKKTIKLDFEIETGFNFDSFTGSGVFENIENFDAKTLEFERASAVLENSIKQLKTQLNYYQETVKFVDENRLLPSDEYKNALQQIEILKNQLAQAHIEYANTRNEIVVRYFERDLTKIQEQTNTEVALAYQKYDKLYATQLEAAKQAEQLEDSKQAELLVSYSKYLDGRRQLSGVLPEKELEIMNEVYEITKAGLEKQKAAYTDLLNSEYLTAEERIRIEKELASIIAQIEDGEIQHTIATNEKRIEAFQNWYNMAQETVTGIANLIGSLADYYEQDIEAKVKAGEMSEEQADKEFENVKKMRIAEALISTFSGAINAFVGALHIPFPAGEIIGGIQAAAVLAMGAARVAQIKNTKRNSSSTTNIGAGVTPQTNVYQPQYVSNPTGDNETQNLRNTMMEQPIYVKVTDIEAAQTRVQTVSNETSF